MKNVLDDEGLENIEFKVSVCTTHGHGNLVAKDLSANHCQGLALSRVNFSGHN